MAIGLAFFHPKTDTNSEKAKLAIYVALALVMLVVIPFLIQRTLRKHRYGLYLSLNKNRIGSLYLGIKTKEFNTIFCVFSLLLVRLFFVILTYSSERNPGILVNFFMLLNNFNIIYIGWFRPYETRS
jgi:membrane protease YdiL (CAAX protease family)